MFAPISTETLATVTGGVHDPEPSPSGGAIVGSVAGSAIGQATCPAPSNPQPATSPHWILI